MFYEMLEENDETTSTEMMIAFAKYHVEKLLEDYEKRLKTVLEEIRICKLDIKKETRLSIKAICYRTFICELKRDLNEL